MIKSQHSRRLEQLVAEHRLQMVNAMLAGVVEWQYRELVGVVRGLDDAVRLSEQADRELSGEI